MHAKRVILGFVSAILLSAASAQAGQPFVVVSDIDDTVKIINVHDKPEAAWNGLFSKKMFLGMAELYRGWVANSDASRDKLVFLSGSPTFLRKRLTKVLGETGFPSARLILKNWFGGGNTKTYKLQAMNELAQQLPESFVMVGDDTEYDPAVYTEFAKSQAPGKSLPIYIRQIRGVELPSGAQPFNTAFDIAFAEVEAGRLSVSDAIAVGERILTAQKPELLFPHYAYCPVAPTLRDYVNQDRETQGVDPRLVMLRNAVWEYSHLYCNSQDQQQQGIVLGDQLLAAPAQ